MSRHSERWSYFRKLNRCGRCGKKDSNTLLGRSLCFECEEKNRLYSKKHYKKYGNPSVKKRYENLKKEGICVDCRKRKAFPGRVRCEICLIKDKQKQAEYKRSLSRDAVKYIGYCVKCCKEPVVDGFSLCETCLEKTRKAAEKGRIVIESNKIKIRMEKGDIMSNYNNEKMETCEYIEAMQKVYFKRPKQENGKCEGFKNKYSHNYSTHCLTCSHLLKEDKNDI